MPPPRRALAPAGVMLCADGAACVRPADADASDGSSAWDAARALVHGRLSAQCDELRQDDWLPIVVINS